MNIKRINNNTKIENSVNLKSNKTPEIPEDWVECELEDICEIKMGQSPPSSTYNTDGNGLPFFQGKAEFTKKYPDVKKWCTEPTRIANRNDILLSVRAPVGSTNIANKTCAIGRGLAALTYKYDYKFIWFYLKSIEKKLESQGTGTTFKAISGKTLKSQKILFPPLPIQRAIVQKIESLFSSLDSGIADLKKAQEQLAIYRQAVLKKAFEEPQGFIKKPVIHKDVLLSEICEMQAGKFVKASNISQENIGNLLFPCYGGNGLRGYVEGYTHDGIFSLIGRQGALCGNVHLVNGKFHATEHAVVVNSDNTVDKVWLFYKLSSMKLNQFSTGVAQPGLAVRTLNSLSIKLPSMDVQRIIVREIESRLSVCDAVEKNIANSLEKAESLRQSILKKAFEGKLLTANEIEQCKQEPDYEPAKKLLEQIKSGG